MRKLQLFGLVGLLAIVLATAPAGAFTFKVGPNLGKLTDWGSIYEPTIDDEVGATPLPNDATKWVKGDWDQTIFSITSLYEPGSPLLKNQYYTGSPELIGMVYDLKIGTITKVAGAVDPDTYQVALVSAGRYSANSGYAGGRVDLWVDTANNFDPAGVGGYPADWGYGSAGGPGWATNPFDAGEYDTFPTATDGTATPLLSGTLVSPKGDGVLLTLTLDFDTGAGVASQGFIDVLYNPTGIPFANQYLGGLAQISFFENFKFWPNASLAYEPDFDDPGTTPIYWGAQSEDPVTFTVLPEPATMSLLGIALVGLGGRALRRRSK